VVVDLAYFGNRSLYRVRVGGGTILEVSAPTRRREANRYLEWDDEVHLSWDKQSALVLKD
jgi:putrescine transport system ATP-binding protein